MGIDIYFENVGRKMLDAVLLSIRLRRRIVICGIISEYNLEKDEGLPNLLTLVSKGIRMQGFVTTDSTIFTRSIWRKGHTSRQATYSNVQFICHSDGDCTDHTC